MGECHDTHEGKQKKEQTGNFEPEQVRDAQHGAGDRLKSSYSPAVPAVASHLAGSYPSDHSGFAGC